ncbi:MAG: biotin transporter BioY [bacterium]|nr:biotin transporter BioY [bacterium]
MKNKSKMQTKTIAQIGLFTAVVAICSQISIPLPSGVPVTLQTLGIALAGFVLGAKYATYSIGIYIALGSVGAPVFAGFSGGPGFITSPAGGFIWGFLFLAFFCGVGCRQKNKLLSVFYGIIGLVICHLFGVVQFMMVAKVSFIASLLAVSVPFLIKDSISIVLAYGIALQVRRALLASDLLEEHA